MNANTEELDSLLETARKATRANEPARVIDACVKALNIAPEDARFKFMQGAALRRSGEYNEAEPLLRAAVKAVPGLAAAHLELGLNLLSLGRLTAARRSLERAVSIDETLRPAWIALCEIRAAEGDHPGAAEAYRRSLGTTELDPALQKAFELYEQGRLGIAEGICREYLRQRPMDVDAIRLLAQIGIDLGIVDEAVKLLERCLELAPEFHLARSNYANALGRQQRFDEALAQMERLGNADPGNLAHLTQTAALQSMAGLFEEAHEGFRNVLERVPGNARILTNLGHSLRFGGKGDEAIEAYLEAIEAEPQTGEAWWSLANLKTFKFDDEQVTAMQKRLAALEKPGADKFHLAFALGKALEDNKDFDRSFAAYAVGNAIKRDFSGYDRDRTTAGVDAAVVQTSADWFDGTGHPSGEPIFIVGLPRAGSTLVEQILASHSQVEATTELPFIGQIANEISGRQRPGEDIVYPGVIAGLAAEQRTALGQKYLARTMVHRNGKPRFIDKLPNNFMHVALIKRILPNATIIDARREPMAACFANFKQLFAQGQEFTYSLEDIGNYYADYLRCMDHWDSILPGGVLTVQYEDVVADLETQVHRLLAHCGLEFEEACVRFHEQERAVRTASSEQVRQPIYKDALELWMNYEEYLGPLKQVLTERAVISR